MFREGNNFPEKFRKMDRHIIRIPDFTQMWDSNEYHRILTGFYPAFEGLSGFRILLNVGTACQHQQVMLWCQI